MLTLGQSISVVLKWKAGTIPGHPYIRTIAQKWEVPCLSLMLLGTHLASVMKVSTWEKDNTWSQLRETLVQSLEKKLYELTLGIVDLTARNFNYVDN